MRYTTTRFFPYYTNPADARCFKCRTTALTEIKRSGSAAGHGDHVGVCPACGMKTWFDLFNGLPKEQAEVQRIGPSFTVGSSD
jgi:hypothetical protein